MYKPPLFALPLAAAVLFAFYSPSTLAQAGSGADMSRKDPADAAVRVPPVVHQSSFAAYQAFSEQEVKDWRESNDNVGRIGGWRVYAQEGRKPTAKPPAVPAAPAAATKPAPAAVTPAAPLKPASSAPLKSGDTPDAHQQHH